MTDVQRALDKQAKLEAEANKGPWKRGPTGALIAVRGEHGYLLSDDIGRLDADLIAHLRNQAALARAVIEVAADAVKSAIQLGTELNRHPILLALDTERLLRILEAWADHVLKETP